MKHVVNDLIIFGITIFSLLGCYTENPLCTDNYCVEGEVFLRSELGDRDYSELNIEDSEILGSVYIFLVVISIAAK